MDGNYAGLSKNTREQVQSARIETVRCLRGSKLAPRTQRWLQKIGLDSSFNFVAFFFLSIFLPILDGGRWSPSYLQHKQAMTTMVTLKSLTTSVVKIKIKSYINPTIILNSRDYKLFRPGHYYHVYNRGDNREPIFFSPDDYNQFTKRLKIALGLVPRGELRIRPFAPIAYQILAYCLMPNHFHLLIGQNSTLPIGLLINKVTTSYAKYFNIKYQRLGHLFQDTFKAKLVDNDIYLTHLSSYIHNNPIDPLSYPYSSMGEYVSGIKDICNLDLILSLFGGNRDDYINFVLDYERKTEPFTSDFSLD